MNETSENIFVRRLLCDSGYAYDPSAFQNLKIALGWQITEEQRIEFVAVAKAMPYKQYLRTVYWGVIRGYLVRERIRCAFCATRARLSVHHTSYGVIGEEWRCLESLEVLCRDCHKDKHGLASINEITKIYDRRRNAWITRGIDAERDRILELLRKG